MKKFLIGIPLIFLLFSACAASDEPVPSSPDNTEMFHEENISNPTQTTEEQF